LGKRKKIVNNLINNILKMSIIKTWEIDLSSKEEEKVNKQI